MRPKAILPGPTQDTRLVTLTKGHFALIDAIDEPRVSSHNWHIRQSCGRFYARTNLPTGCPEKPQVTRDLHTFILTAAPGLEIDHINGDSLDNRRSNLRVVTHSQNMHNCKLRADNSSGVKGVWKRGPSYRAAIHIENSLKSLGSFSTLEAATQAITNARFNLGLATPEEGLVGADRE